jgi:hypothetical protein
MKLLVHLIKKDARALENLWCIWVLLVAVQVGAAVALSLPYTRDLARYQYVQGYFYGLGAAWMLMAYLLAGAVILQDPPVGTRIFWMTRPISGGMLIRAKLVAILIFLVLVPAVVWLPWWVACGFGVFDIAAESIKMAELAFLAVAPAVILGAISGDGPRFMLYNIVGLAAAWTLGLVLALRSADSAHGTVVTRTWLGLLVMAGFAIAAVATQYRSRRWGRAVAQLLSGVVLGTTAAAFLPFDASALFKTTPKPAEFANQVQFSVHLISVNPNPGPRDTHEVSLSVGVEGSPSDTSLSPGTADVELSWPDGTRFESRGIRLTPRDAGARDAVAAVLGVPVSSVDLETKARQFAILSELRRKHGEEPLAKQPEYARDIGYWVNFPVDSAAAKKFESGPPACTLDLKARFQRPEVLFQIPLVAGHSGAGGGMSAHVLSAAAVHNEKPKMSYYSAWIHTERAPDADTRLFGIERGIPGGVLDFSRNGGPSVDFVDSSLAFEPMDRMHVSIPFPRLWRENQWVEREWAQEPTLLAVRFHDAGGLARTVRLEHLTTAAR